MFVVESSQMTWTRMNLEIFKVNYGVKLILKKI